MKDYLARAITTDGRIRGLACITTDLTGRAAGLHQTCPTVSAALGRALTGGTLMGALLDDEQRVALKFEGSGPMHKILVEADSRGNVRGYPGQVVVNLPPNAAGKLDVSGALGRAGFLTVTKDLRLKEPYQGTVELYSGEIAEDIAYYFSESEQIPSAVGLGVFVNADNTIEAAGGFLIQSMPPSDENMLDELAGRISAMAPVTQMIKDGKDPEAILAAIFAEIPYRILETRPLDLRCTCSRQRVERALITLGKHQIEDILSDNEDQLAISCEFCHRHYTFGREELHKLLSESH